VKFGENSTLVKE